jgi:hypothetical protein
MTVFTGHCGCGAVSFEVTEQPVAVGYCHCTRCQRRTGTAAAISATVPPGALRILSGEELVAAWEPEGGWAKCFCSACGSAVWSRGPDGSAGIRLGGIDGDPGLRPQWHQFVAYAAPWEPIPDDGLPRYPERRPPGT